MLGVSPRLRTAVSVRATSSQLLLHLTRALNDVAGPFEQDRAAGVGETPRSCGPGA
jgi:hypothetical protein